MDDEKCSATYTEVVLWTNVASMPTLIAAAVQVTVRGTMDSRNWANVFHVAPSGTKSPLEQAQAVLDDYVAHVLPVLTSDVQVLDAAFVDLEDDTGPTGIVTPTLPADLTGGVSAPACPPNTTYLVRWSGLSARGVRNGRSYLPGVREDEVANGGAISPTTTGTVQTAVNDFAESVLADADAPLVTVHHPSGGDPTVTEILSASVQSLVATQRRRLRS